MPPPWSGGERQPDAELNWTGALRKANLADRVIQFDQPGLLNLRMEDRTRNGESRSAENSNSCSDGKSENQSTLLANQNPCQAGKIDN